MTLPKADAVRVFASVTTITKLDVVFASVTMKTKVDTVCIHDDDNESKII